MSYASDLERLMLDLVNAERAAAGVAPLALELHLNAAAERHSDWMLDTDVFSHTGIGGSTPGERMTAAGFSFSGSWSWGENVAWQSERGAAGIADDVANLHTSLMNSPGHRANILSPNFTLMGIGVEVGDYKGWSAVMVTQTFARTAAPVALDTGEAPVPNAAPSIAVGRIVVDAHGLVPLSPHVQVTDADGDSAVRFRIRDADGIDSVRFKGALVDADPGFTFKAAALDKVGLVGDAPGDRQVLRIKVFDGEDWSGWDRFVLRTGTGPTVEDMATGTDDHADIARQPLADPSFAEAPMAEPIPAPTPFDLV